MSRTLAHDLRRAKRAKVVEVGCQWPIVSRLPTGLTPGARARHSDAMRCWPECSVFSDQCSVFRCSGAPWDDAVSRSAPLAAPSCAVLHVVDGSRSTMVVGCLSHGTLDSTTRTPSPPTYFHTCRVEGPAWWSEVVRDRSSGRALQVRTKCMYTTSLQVVSSER